ncbi:aspartate carbamoyltransferase regulatory subunit [Suicoccus acidiformans]|uniref:Aspartate carbamoyltransferase regulatory subunit n=1 Tax=Suicoccus acidiformans TaxID=2036206 RepID=A0A347WL39_9LACT|nr:aspartate carbamoyltransferase regulatory subunit [Suicoccus acidiformans]AXY25796.1 aspartate carbamoyltransferase regulatory subunit [Suicoccus acidiformans]
MLEVTSIENGIVIDHIHPGHGIKIFNLLRLDQFDDRVALMMNVDSQLQGRKDIIKIQGDLTHMDFDILGVVDPHITVNYIQNGQIIKKGSVELPERIHSYLSCTNPRCITQTERYAQPSFVLVDAEESVYACEYCDHLYDAEEIK